MTIAREYVPEKRHAKLTPGRALQIARELQELSQSELARRTGIAQSAISAFESGSQEMGLKRVRVLAEHSVCTGPSSRSRTTARHQR